MKIKDTCSLWSARGCPTLEDLPGGDSGGEPPVPIPNTEVKPASADGTWGATPWESRSPPGIKIERVDIVGPLSVCKGHIWLTDNVAIEAGATGVALRARVAVRAVRRRAPDVEGGPVRNDRVLIEARAGRQVRARLVRIARSSTPVGSCRADNFARATLNHLDEREPGRVADTVRAWWAKIR